MWLFQLFHGYKSSSAVKPSGVQCVRSRHLPSSAKKRDVMKEGQRTEGSYVAATGRYSSVHLLSPPRRRPLSQDDEGGIACPRGSVPFATRCSLVNPVLSGAQGDCKGTMEENGVDQRTQTQGNTQSRCPAYLRTCAELQCRTDTDRFRSLMREGKSPLGKIRSHYSKRRFAGCFERASTRRIPQSENLFMDGLVLVFSPERLR